MKIGINGFESIVPRFGYDVKTNLPIRVGSAQVCFELIRNLAKVDLENDYIVYLPQKPSSDMPKETDRLKYKVVRGKRLWTLLALNKAVNKDKLDLFFNPTHYSPLFLNCPMIISILDVSYKYYPELFKKKDLYKLSMWGKYSVRKARRIVTISKSSKDDIIKEYGISEAKVEVIPVGIREIQKNSMSKSEFIEKYHIKTPYILFVGTLQPRKNIKRLIEAVSQIENKEVSLVIVGKKGWQYGEILSAPQLFNVSDRVQFVDNVSDEDLPLFYENAELFVLPSLYEGFGLPVLEAMKYGCPVITSDVSSLPEAGGDAALYVNPEKTSSIVEKINEVLSNKVLREKMVNKGKEHIKQFSWEKSAAKMIQIFKEIS